MGRRPCMGVDVFHIPTIQYVLHVDINVQRKLTHFKCTIEFNVKQMVPWGFSIFDFISERIWITQQTAEKKIRST